MAESIGIDSARLVLAHALLFTFGKASLGFFEVVDSVSCLESIELDSKSALDFINYLESERLDFKFCFCESLDSIELDSVFESKVSK